MYGGASNTEPQLDRFLNVLGERRAALAQQLEDIEVVLGEIDMLERQCRDLLNDRMSDKSENQGT